MLACARLGAVHSVVFGGFRRPELAARIDDAAPRAVVSASCGIEEPLPGARVQADPGPGDRAASRKPERCVVLHARRRRPC